MDLRGLSPTSSFQYLVNTGGNFIYDGTGSIIKNLNLSSSYIYPSAGTVSLMNNATGSPGGSPGSFSSNAELVAFISAVSSSFITINDLISKLQIKGIIS